MLVQRASSILMLSVLGLLALQTAPLPSLHAGEANAVGWHGITPGQSTEADLLENEQWQNRLGPPVRDGAAIHWTFRFPVWRKVVAEVRDGQVRVIDVIPPARLRAELLAEKLDLGELSPVSATRLPASVLVGPEEISAFRPLRCGKASNVLLFVHESQGNFYVQVMRIVAPGSLQETPTGPPATEKEVPGGTPARSPVRPDVSLSATAFTKFDQSHPSVVAAVSLLEKYHVSHHPLDDALARRAWSDLLARFDPGKQLLTQRDLESFDVRLGRFADDLKRGDMRLAYELAALLQQRAEARSQQVARLLREPSPLESRAAAALVESLGTYAANDAALQERCRQRVGYLVAHHRRNGASTSEARQRTGEQERMQLDRLAQLKDEDIRQAILAALAFAYGPGTSYAPEPAPSQGAPSSTQRIVGIGAQAVLRNGVPTVLDVLVGGSASRDGRLQPGDRILAVAEDSQGNYRDVLAMPLPAVVERIRGPEGSHVRLRVLPANQRQPAEYELARTPFPPPVAGALLAAPRLPGNQDKKIGYLSVPAFQEVAEEFDPALADSFQRTMPKELQDFFLGLSEEGKPLARSTSQIIEHHLREYSRQGVDAVVLDLRGNQGGKLAEALAVTGLFIGSAPAGQLQMNDGRVYPVKATGQRSWSGPLVVATDRATTDEGELVAAALQDYGAAVLVGEVTTAANALFTSVHASQDIGKSLFDSAEAPKMGIVRLPDAMLYRITGAGIQRRGVRPDVILAASSTRLAPDDGSSELYSFDRIGPVPHEKIDAVTDTTRLFLTEKSHLRRTGSPPAEKEGWRPAPLREVPWLVFDAPFREVLAVTLDLIALEVGQKK